MSSVRAPGLGPIVGHTTATSCRLWIRGADPGDAKSNLDENSRTIGVISVLKPDGKPDPKQTYYFRLHRQYDRTGTFNLGADGSFGLSKEEGGGDRFPLSPDTTYRVRMGTLLMDDPFENDETVDSKVLLKRLPPPSVWVDDLAKLQDELSVASFRTFPDTTSPTLTFLLGSCRYPGLLWKRKESDTIFRPMLDRVIQKPDGKEPRFILMVGDQIYADMFNRLVPIGLADTFEEFQERYHSAFGSRNMRTLLRSVPHYMILDDHEIEDNWSQDRIRERQKRQLFNIAIGAYLSYQWSHGPRTYGLHLYYAFECGGYPFFVLDCRTERFRDDDPESLEDNHMLGRPSPQPALYPSQIDVLSQWLVEQQEKRGDAPKFVVSPSVFVPNEVRTVGSEKWKNASDSWEAFPQTRRLILKTIVAKNIQNVVFLSGDIHCSCVAELRFSGTPAAKKLRAFALTSSAFYWPFPFADGAPSNYVHDSTKRETRDTFKVTDKVVMDYTAYNFTQEDNFCQVDVAGNELLVQAFGKDGKRLRQAGLGGASRDLAATLALAPWA